MNAWVPYGAVSKEQLKDLAQTDQVKLPINPFTTALKPRDGNVEMPSEKFDMLSADFAQYPFLKDSPVFDGIKTFSDVKDKIDNKFDRDFQGYLDDIRLTGQYHSQIETDSYIATNANKLLRDLAKSEAEHAHYGRSSMDILDANTKDVRATTEKLKERVRNVIRLGEIQEYYNGYYDTKKSIIFETILVFFILVVLYALKQNELLPEPLFNFFFVVILFVFIFFRLFRNIADFVSRDKQYFDKYDWGAIDGSFNPVEFDYKAVELDPDGDAYAACRTFVKDKSVLDVVNVLEYLVTAHATSGINDVQKGIIKAIMTCMVKYVNGQYSQDNLLVTEIAKTKLQSGGQTPLFEQIDSITTPTKFIQGIHTAPAAGGLSTVAADALSAAAALTTGT